MSALVSLVLVLGLGPGAHAAPGLARTADIIVLDRPQTAYAQDTGASILCGRPMALSAAVTLDLDNVSALCTSRDLGTAPMEARSIAFNTGAPEASVWAMVVLGFACVGAFLRGRRRARGGSSRSSK
ncbi:MAG TPA: hypothetical protein VKQ54_02690 [Caulobacteraceae bacterium]|nr:hypothetical protein [Caulobacteraceae bacterium]